MNEKTQGFWLTAIIMTVKDHVDGGCKDVIMKIIWSLVLLFVISGLFQDILLVRKYICSIQTWIFFKKQECNVCSFLLDRCSHNVGQPRIILGLQVLLWGVFFCITSNFAGSRCHPQMVVE